MQQGGDSVKFECPPSVPPPPPGEVLAKVYMLCCSILGKRRKMAVARRLYMLLLFVAFIELKGDATKGEGPGGAGACSPANCKFCGELAANNVGACSLWNAPGTCPDNTTINNSTFYLSAPDFACPAKNTCCGNKFIFSCCIPARC